MLEGLWLQLYQIKMDKLLKFFWFLKTQFLRLRGMKIGQMTYVANPLFIYGANKIYVGNKVRIFPGIRLEVHDNGSIKIDDDVAIGQHVHITSAKENLVIGAHSTILGNVFVTNIEHDYQEIGVHVMQQKLIVKTTVIGENCFIGYGSAIQAGTILGRQCIVGANSVVRGTFPDFSVIVGAPARIVKRYNFALKKWQKVDSENHFM